MHIDQIIYYFFSVIILCRRRTTREDVIRKELYSSGTLHKSELKQERIAQFTITTLRNQYRIFTRGVSLDIWCFVILKTFLLSISAKWLKIQQSPEFNVKTKSSRYRINSRHNWLLKRTKQFWVPLSTFWFRQCLKRAQSFFNDSVPVTGVRYKRMS